MRRKIRTTHIQAHPLMYEKMEEFRKEFKKINGINLSQEKITNIFAQNINLPKIKSIFEIKKKIKKR